MFKKMLLFVLFTLTLGCGNEVKQESARITPEAIATTEVPKVTLTPQEQKIDDLKKKLDASDKKIMEVADGKLIDRLTAEKESLGLRVQLADAYSEQWKLNAKSYEGQKVEKDQELKNAKLDSWKEKLWWMAGICGFAAIVAGGISFAFPLIRPIAIKASIAMGAIATIMLITAQCITTVAWLLSLVPYILCIGAIGVIIYAIIALRHWWKDHQSLKQTIEGIEPIKAQVANFSDHMLKFVDGNMVKHVKKIREKIK